MGPNTDKAAFDKILNAVRNGEPVYVRPYKEPKVWGVDGIGEYWYGAEEGSKSSTAVVGNTTFPLYEIFRSAPDIFLGEKAIARFGAQFPLVKILTPKNRLSVQFHDVKNELWIVTGVDKTIAGEKPWAIVGFSRKSVDSYGKNVTKHYKKALEKYGEELNGLIDLMINQGCEKLLDKNKDVEFAAIEAVLKRPDSLDIAKALDKLNAARKKLDTFYNRQYVEIGDVIPIPSGTLHALGPGVEVIEPQISGHTQSLEDGATYPTRYAFPAYPRKGAKKMLDIDRVCEMRYNAVEKEYSEVIKKTNHITVERLPGGFEDKGLEVHRITLKKNAVFQQTLVSFHNLVAIEGNSSIITNDIEYNIPKALPNGNMLIVPASTGNYKIVANENAQILDTFVPI